MALTKLTEPTVWGDDILLPHDVVDDCSILSLHPAFQALGGRTRELQAQKVALEQSLAAATTQITALQTSLNQAESALGELRGRTYLHDAPAGTSTYTLPEYSDIRVLGVHLQGTGSTLVTIDLGNTQHDGRELLVRVLFGSSFQSDDKITFSNLDNNYWDKASYPAGNSPSMGTASGNYTVKFVYSTGRGWRWVIG